ncbi:apolipoprotein N-acyltransferase [Virgisporangium aliadipatigenens]|uniref:Apolipoprotein N-acyltransferase n=1 Tax=Virgisporangium aliadipatigenens TaxID=741659 RepID=A0A8J3YKD0_9ACTN|nr:apolipoprotein N-acyltransferase [Virgisporangium aliadipatigenens]GIJ45540.1 apolipoprotein N-acyltransferase [Virgisporangium aliadipatigenens]
MVRERPVEAAPPTRRLPGFVIPSALAVASGVALLLAFPSYDQWYLAPVGVALLALAAHGQRMRFGALLGFVSGALYLGIMLYWTGLHVGAFPWLALSALQAAYLALMGAATAFVSPLLAGRPWLWGPVTGGLWVTQELLRGTTPFGGFPWGRLAFSQADSPLLALAALGGAPLVTFTVGVIGGLLAGAWVVLRAHGGRPPTPDLRRLGALLGTAVVLVTSGLVVAPLTPEPAGRAVTVAIIQGNVPRMGFDFNAQRRAVLDNHVSRTLELAQRVAAGQAARPDLVIWPENASDIDPLTNEDAAAQISRAADTIGVPILVGAVLHDDHSDNILNAGLIWHPGTGAGDRYIKRHPVPFGEYVPYRSFFRVFSKQVDRIRSDFIAGDRPGVLTLGPATVGDVICYEVAYDGIVRDTVTGGAGLLVVQTNNATFNLAESEQQLAMVRLRAVEHGRPGLMASTVGVSGFVDARGHLYGATSFFKPAVVVREMRLGAGRTLATRLGAVPEYLMVAGVLVALFLVARTRRRAAPAKEDT